MNYLYALVAGLYLGVPIALTATVPTKLNYTLFNPTPPSVMRELSTDRPDQTESPYTVDAGHFQIELDMAKGSWDHDKATGNDLVSREQNFANANLKIGLTNSIDLQLIATPFNSTEAEDRVSNTTIKSTGFGDFSTRLKINVWGNDEGDSAFAIMPFIKWPLPVSAIRNGKTEGGIIFPYSRALSETMGLGTMLELDFVSNGAILETEYFTTATVSQTFSEQLGGYVEIAVRLIPNAPWQSQFDLGTTYGFSDDLQFDVGANIGFTPDAPDLTVFAGITWRR